MSIPQTQNGAQHHANGNGHRAPGQPAGTLRFQVNVPEQVALKFATGREVEGQFGPQLMFTLVDGRRMYLDPPVAESVEQLGVRPRELFTICKRKGIGTGNSVRWQIERLDAPSSNGNGNGHAAQQHDTPAPAYGSNLERQLATSIEHVERAKANGNGSAANGGATAVAIDAATMTSALRVAVDAVHEAELYAKKQHGLDVEFSAEDIRAIGLSLYISRSREGGWR